MLSEVNTSCTDESRSASSCSKEEHDFLEAQLQNLKRDYAMEIDAHLRAAEAASDVSRNLERHEIQALQRAKMLDWMVEVLAVFRCSDQVFFQAVNILDRYFKQCQEVIPVKDLHLSGVVAMFLASKYEDIVPLTLKTVQEKIGHAKFSDDDIM